MAKTKTNFVAARLTKAQMARLRTKALVLGGNLSEALRDSVMKASVQSESGRRNGVQPTHSDR
jgi:hypothetical protein